MTPKEVNPSSIQSYPFVGFGAGINSGKHSKGLLDLTDNLPQLVDKKAFIYSTSGVSNTM